ncbi:MAG: molybdenum cofactor guanylyltransferase [Spirochaetales bacterium]|nr:molybdenum cofactor guanylyltransferase [Spirochaetales bacterium]
MSKNSGRGAAILAGGSSCRFGSDKAVIETREGPLIKWIADQLMDVFDEVIVIANDPERYDFLELPVYPDLLKGRGPLGGVHAGLVASSFRHTFFTACDMPFISIPLIRHMESVIIKSSPPALVACRDGFVEPFHGFYSRDLVSLIETFSGNEGGGIYAFLRTVSYLRVEQDRLLQFCPDGRIFKNINRMEDLSLLGDLACRSASISN